MMQIAAGMQKLRLDVKPREWMNRGVIDMDLHFAFLYSAVQKIGEWGTQPPSGFLPPSPLFPRFWKAGGVSLSAESDEGSALDPQAF
jgi:hydroxyacyl-ACP dehydratase HTD2-like protein with hotdog domain